MRENKIRERKIEPIATVSPMINVLKKFFFELTRPLLLGDPLQKFKESAQLFVRKDPTYTVVLYKSYFPQTGLDKTPSKHARIIHIAPDDDDDDGDEAYNTEGIGKHGRSTSAPKYFNVVKRDESVWRNTIAARPPINIADIVTVDIPEMDI